VKLFSFICIVLISFCFQISCTSQKAKEQKQLNLFIWGGYFVPASVQQFEKQTGIKVNISEYNSNEELLTKLQAGASGYDIIIPSDYMVKIMIKTELLQKLDPNQLSQFSKLDPQLLNQSYDPKNEYSIPYAWSTTGIARNTSQYPEKVTSWKQVWGNKNLQNRFTMLDDPREVISAVLKTQNQSVNTMDSKALNEVKKQLKTIKPHIRALTSDPKPYLINGDFLVSQMFSSDALNGKYVKKGPIEYVIPEDGCTMAIDNFAIPKTAKNLKEAYEFINFNLQKEVNVEFVKIKFGGPVVMGVKELLPTEIQNDEALFPNKKVLSRCEMIQDLGEKTSEIDQIWTEFKVTE